MILLRRNNQVDESFSYPNENMIEGEAVELVKVERYKHLPPNIIFKSNDGLRLHGDLNCGDLNCFDYVRQAKK